MSDTSPPSFRERALAAHRDREAQHSREAEEYLERRRSELRQDAGIFIRSRLGDDALEVEILSIEVAGYGSSSTAVYVKAADLDLVYVEPQASRGNAVLVAKPCMHCQQPTPVGSELRAHHPPFFLADLGAVLAENPMAVCSNCYVE